MELSAEVPADSYFVSAEYTGTGYNAQLAARVCILSSRRIEGRAVYRWWPLWRRGLIRTDE